MKYIFISALAATACFSSISDAIATTHLPLTVSSKSVANGKPIPTKFAYCMPDDNGKSKNAENISPEISWANAPKNTKSFAIVVVDPDVPAEFDDANKDGKTIAENFPRKNFYHWLQFDIPANITNIGENMGKKSTSGISLTNDFAGGKNAPEFAGYDGPCPPWNDARLHHYHFTIHALDVEKLGVDKNASLSDAVAAIEKHTIAKGKLVGTYSNYKAGK